MVLFFLSGCRSSLFGSHTIIDWVDFIKWDGITYDAIYSGALADTKFIGKKVGEVKFRVADNVTNPNYKTRNGDAAFHEKGTGIYSIKGHPEFIAVKSPREVNGYRIYFSREEIEFKWHFKDMPTEKVNTIEIYLAHQPKGTKEIAAINEADQVKQFLELLTTSKENPNFQPNTESGDPVYYEMVFFTDEPIAYKFGLQFDGSTYFWHPWDTSIISDEMAEFIPKD
jgi:hypothetical protein